MKGVRLVRWTQAKPLARSQGLLLEHVGDETVVYDTDSKEAHSLSPLAAVVFDRCDGHSSVDELANAASERLGEAVDSARVLDALAQLEERSLLAIVGRRDGLSRRDLFRKSAAVGAAAVAVPVITTIAVPTAHAAATPTCGDIFCCPCDSGDFGQPCCIHPTAFQCNCTARESGASCKQCKPQGAAATEGRCLTTFPGGTRPGFPPNSDTVCPCTFAQTNCAQ